MQNFIIYPKEGKEFSVTIDKFEQKDEQFILYNDVHQPSSEGFLAFDKVAAIVPERQYEEKMLRFLVHLRDRTEPIKVFASAFTLGPPITFKIQQRDMRGDIYRESVIENVYVAPSEVVAIIPEDGLLSYRG